MVKLVGFGRRRPRSRKNEETLAQEKLNKAERYIYRYPPRSTEPNSISLEYFPLKREIKLNKKVYDADSLAKMLRRGQRFVPHSLRSLTDDEIELIWKKATPDTTNGYKTPTSSPRSRSSTPPRRPQRPHRSYPNIDIEDEAGPSNLSRYLFTSSPRH